MRDFDWLDCVIGRYWEMVERLKIKHFYTAPTAIRGGGGGGGAAVEM